MPKPEDAVVPILRSIQKKLTEIETKFEARLDRVESKIDHVVERVDTIEAYLTYTMGETSQNKRTSSGSTRR